MPSIRTNQKNAVSEVQKELNRISGDCRWTSGTWSDLGNLQWNELQNVPRHITHLSNLLIRKYTRSWGDDR